MTNSNLDNNQAKNSAKTTENEPELNIENSGKTIDTVESATKEAVIPKVTEPIVTEPKVVEPIVSLEDTIETNEDIETAKKLDISIKPIANYLDRSIINIKKYNLEEIDADVDITSAADSAIYDSGLNTKEREVVDGTVVRVTDRDVFIDIGFKSEGIVSKNEFNKLPIVGDIVQVFIVIFEDRKGNLILSRERAEFMLKWNELKAKFESSEVVEGRIIRRIKGGMIVDLGPVQGFLPGSQIDVKPITNFDEYVGITSEFKIVKFNELRQNIVLSRKAILATDLDDRRKEILEELKTGDIVDGIIKNITDFGAFVDLGGLDGLLHITDITWGRINHPSDKLTIGDEIKVKIIDYDAEKVRVSLGLKQLHDEPWQGIEEKYPVGSVVQGKIVNMMKYGAFVELEEGVEGLIHVSEMSWTRHIKHPTDLFKIGDKLEAKILTVESKEKKISLGLKQLESNPWDDIEDKYTVDEVYKGVVKNLTQYGAFVQLEEGIDGLVHVSDMSWTESVRHPNEVLAKGDEVTVKVLDLSSKEHRLSLGIKQVIDNPWDSIVEKYQAGVNVDTKVNKVIEKGIIVKIEDNIEGIVPFKSLSKEERKIIKDIFVPDFELTVTVQEVDIELKKIILIVDFSKYLELDNSNEEPVSKEKKTDDGVDSEES
jgi:small subunit ribosomal protein S1